MNSCFEGYVDLLNRCIDCSCGRNHSVPIKKVVVEKDAIKQLDKILQQLGLGTFIHVVMDINTCEIAGNQIVELLRKAERKVSTTVFKTKDLIADEKALEVLLSALEEQVDCLVAVGSGTINDLSRYAAYKLGKPYVIVATAPSMDGYASSVSPLVINGFKRTYSADAPLAIIGDVNILSQAPESMIVAGFGDLLGKITCQCDWKLGRLLHEEYYCEYVSSLINKAVEICTKNIYGLKNREEQAVESLMHGLILSGIGMLMVGNSRPASGCEHHLSHFWEMKYIQEGRKQLLHGQKVGVATVIMAEYYNKLKLLDKDQVKNLLSCKKPVSNEDRIKQIKESFGSIAEEVIRENFSENISNQDEEEITEKWNHIRQILEKVPESAQVKSFLQAVNAPSTPEELGITPDLAEEGIRNCMYVRNRYTVLRVADTLGLL